MKRYTVVICCLKPVCVLFPELPSFIVPLCSVYQEYNLNTFEMIVMSFQFHYYHYYFRLHFTCALSQVIFFLRIRTPRCMHVFYCRNLFPVALIWRTFTDTLAASRCCGYCAGNIMPSSFNLHFTEHYSYQKLLHTVGYVIVINCI
jgi:hypothetical protein